MADESQLLNRLSTAIADLSIRDATSWGEELAAREFSSVAGKTEQAFQDDPTNFAARLAWIVAQVEIGEIPLAALTVPLEEFAQRFEEERNPGLALIASHAALRVARKLLEKKQSRLGVNILEKAYGFLASVPGDVRQRVWECLLEALESELQRGAVRRENKQYLASVENRIASLRSAPPQKLSPQTVDSGKVAPAAPKKRGFTSKSILERAASSAAPQTNGVLSDRGGLGTGTVIAASSPLSSGSIDLQGSSPESWERAPIPEQTGAASFGREPGAMTVIRTTPNGVAETRGFDFQTREGPEVLRDGALTFSRASKFIGGAIGLFAIVWLILSSFESDDEGLLEHRLAMGLRRAPVGSVALVPELSAGDSSESSLSALSKRLQNLGENRESEVRELPPVEGAGQVSAGDSNTATSSERGSSEIVVTPPSERAPLAHQQANVVDGKTMDGNPADRRKVPQLDVDQISDSVVQSLGLTMDSVKSDGLTRGGDGRVYGPPPGSKSDGSVALDGSPVKEYEVEQFKEPLRYRILAATKIVSAPSVVGQTLAELKPDAVVQVVSRMGRWLEIRSTGGRRGFIYAQDAVAE